jgi:integrase
VQSFGLRVTDRGTKTFFIMRRRAGDKHPSRIALGSYPGTTLLQARRKATDALKALVEGNHPREIEERARLARAQLQANSFASVAEQFIQRHVAKLRSCTDVERAIRRELITRWGERPIAEITRRDVVAAVEDMIDRGHPRGAGLLLAYARKLWNWAAAREMVEASPCDRIKTADLIGTPKPRERVLNQAELWALWAATAGEDYPLDPFVRILLITGARRNEVARMTWDELDLDPGIWRLSGDRTKNQEPRVLPLPQMAVELLRSLPKWSGPYVFSTRFGDRPISGFAKLKIRLDRRLVGVAPWRLHDLRRTMRTNLSTLRIELVVRELMIGHRQQGIVAVYDQHKYVDEQRDGFEAWCGRLRSIVEGSPDNVVKLRAAAQAVDIADPSPI